MKVKELIKRLGAFKGDSDICVTGSYGCETNLLNDIFELTEEKDLEHYDSKPKDGSSLVVIQTDISSG